VVYVVGAYLVVGGLFAAYVWTLAARQRMLAEMADAVGLGDPQ
jgi:hypothetical protein